MNKEELLKLYEIHVNILDKFNDRREKSNHFFISVLTAIILMTSYFLNENKLNTIINPRYFLTSIGVLGCILCFVWHFLIRAYRRINSKKFEILEELENKLEFKFYQLEREKFLTSSNKEYNGISKIDMILPLIISLPFLALVFVTIFKY